MTRAASSGADCRRRSPRASPRTARQVFYAAASEAYQTQGLGHPFSSAPQPCPRGVADHSAVAAATSCPVATDGTWRRSGEEERARVPGRLGPLVTDVGGMAKTQSGAWIDEDVLELARSRSRDRSQSIGDYTPIWSGRTSTACVSAAWTPLAGSSTNTRPSSTKSRTPNGPPRGRQPRNGPAHRRSVDPAGRRDRRCR